MKKLPLTFFKRPALVVAKELIGASITLRRNGAIERHKITETEAYIGPHDLASHSSKGRTKRTEVMYAAPGTIYIYLIYGMYYMLNIVTDEKDYPAAVLIRAVEGISGPGTLAKELGIDKRLNGMMLGNKSGIWIEKDEYAPLPAIIKTPRIGVAYAGPIWAEKKYRFVLK